MILPRDPSRNSTTVQQLTLSLQRYRPPVQCENEALHVLSIYLFNSYNGLYIYVSFNVLFPTCLSMWCTLIQKELYCGGDCWHTWLYAGCAHGK
ncbi:uncharacterized protein ARMOST_10934 [Armillaria ostoyae]|uniref:Uncharacterized protein n=1 Tax=Armillaria ostoyae TaxID=47428 RepID=A0A284RFQ9_ARMOS|nr:uncharacterized protein ARMOST_10934 [Armillaria ostoyae]